MESEKRTYYLVKKLINTHNRTGKRDGAGFYDYPKGEQKRLWKGLKEVFKQKKDAFTENIISKRLLHRQSLESFRCLAEEYFVQQLMEILVQFLAGVSQFIQVELILYRLHRNGKFYKGL